MATLHKHDAYRIQRSLLTASALGFALGPCPVAIANPFGSAPVSDQALGSMRGGFNLPNGMMISVGMQIETYVNGNLALRTVLNVTDRTMPALQVTVPAASNQNIAERVTAIESANPTVAAALGNVPAAQAPSAPSVAAETMPVATIAPTLASAPPASVAASETAPAPIAPAVAPLLTTTITPTISVAVQSSPAAIASATPVASAPSAPTGINTAISIVAPTQSDLGQVTIQQMDRGSTVILKGPDLEIQHMTGNSTGILIANTLDNRAIDTIASVNISLTDSAIPVGNVMLRIDSIVLDAVGSSIY